jgi:uncharacterized repeat protein (TIGR01451 family)
MRARFSSIAFLVAALAACAEQGVAPPKQLATTSPPTLAPAIGVDSVTGASIETNQDDYAPGEVVHVVGKGWAPGETVKLYMTEEPDTHGPVSIDVTADASGGFSLHFYDVQVHDIGSVFTLTATGSVSGSKAVAVFTDANFRLIHSGGTVSDFDANIIVYSSTGCATGPGATNTRLVRGTPGGVNGTLATAAAIQTQSVRFAIPRAVGSNTFVDFTHVEGTSTLVSSTVTPDSAYLCVNGLASAGNNGWRANFSTGTPDLTITKSHSGDFTRGLTGTYTVTVTNSGTASTSGSVTVTDVLPAGLTVSTLTGTGWTCNTATASCVRSDALSAGSSYPAISLVVNVGAATAASVTNTASVSGGGETNTGNNSASDPTTVVSNSATVTVTRNPNANTVFGQSVTFTATVTGSGPTPAGTVDFYLGTSCGGTQLGTQQTLVGGAGSVTVTPAVGSHTITACFTSADANYSSSTGQLAHEVTRAQPIITLTDSPDPIFYGNAVTFTAAIAVQSPGGGTPTGTLRFYLGGTCNTDGTGTGTLLATNTIPGNGTTDYQLVTSTLPVGTPTVLACYGGDANFLHANDSESTTVNRATTSLALTSSLNPSYFGNSVTFEAAISVTSGGALTATGSVNFSNGGTCNTSTGAISGGTALGSATLDGTGKATLAIATLAAGTHTIVACYGETTNFAGSQGSLSQVVNKATTSLALASSLNPSTFGDNVTFTATISFTNGAATITGQSVKFSVGGTCDVATGSITGGTTDLGTASIGAGNQATVQVSNLPVATHSIVACYGGNANIVGSTNSLSQVVNPKPTSLALTVDPASQQYSDSVEFRVSITPFEVAGSQLTGNVHFYVAAAATACGTSAPAGAVATAAISDPDNGSDSASYKVDKQAGSYRVTACFYPTNSNFAGSDQDQGLTVTREHASGAFDATNPDQILNSSTTFSLKVTFRETVPEQNPVAERGQGTVSATTMPVASVTMRLTGQGTNTNYNGVCGSPTYNGGSGYLGTATFTCTFSGGPFIPDVYTILADVNSNHFIGTAEDLVALWDPNAGFATGGGKFMLDGERVNFGFSYTITKGRTTPRGGMVALRHLAGGGVCRIKSNSLDLPAVGTITGTSYGYVSLAGKGNYSCVDAFGVPIPNSGAGNLTIQMYAEDRATSGANADKFWVTNSAPAVMGSGPTAHTNKLKMAAPGASNAQLLTGGNVQVPQPGGGK